MEYHVKFDKKLCPIHNADKKYSYLLKYIFNIPTSLALVLIS